MYSKLKMKNFDLVVLGAGPVGLTAANIVACSGYKVTAIERKKQIGYPNHCSGLVSPEFIKLNKMPKELIMNRIKGAELICREENLLFKNNVTHAYVINRAKFDRNLADEAEKNGVKISKGITIKSWRRNKENIIIRLMDGEEINTHLIIIASGALTGLSRMFGFFISPSELIHTIQVDVSIPLKDNEIVHTFFDNRVAHNWFSWIIPLGNGMVHVGLGTDRNENMIGSLEQLFKENPYLSGIKFYKNKAVAWIIPIGQVREATKDNVMVIGDAAMQVKPFSGGGLHTGIMSAKFAAEAALNALKQSDYSKESLSSYKMHVDEEIAPKIKRGLFLRKIYRSMSDAEKENFLKSVNNHEAKNIILSNGDIDFPLNVAKKLFKFVKEPLFKYFTSLLVGTANE